MTELDGTGASVASPGVLRKEAHVFTSVDWTVGDRVQLSMPENDQECIEQLFTGFHGPLVTAAKVDLTLILANNSSGVKVE